MKKKKEKNISQFSSPFIKKKIRELEFHLIVIWSLLIERK